MDGHHVASRLVWSGLVWSGLRGRMIVDLYKSRRHLCWDERDGIPAPGGGGCFGISLVFFG